MTRKPTPKQELLAHIREHHKGIVKGSDRWHRGTGHGKKVENRTLVELQRAHGENHHRTGDPTHFHAGVNRGPDERPPGWKTGRDVILRQRARY